MKTQKKIAEQATTFAEEVNKVLSGADTTATHLRVSPSTPKILQDIGLSDKPILITANHAKTAVGDVNAKGNLHRLSIDTFKQLPKLLESPAIIMESTQKGQIVAFVNAVDISNSPIMCAIMPDGTGNYNNVEVSANILKSVYGKSTNPTGFIEKAVNEGRILYWDKKISQGIFETPGLRLPDNLKNLDSNTIIRRIGEKSIDFSKNPAYQAIKQGSGADVSKIRRGQNATSQTGNVKTPQASKAKTTQKKNTSRKGGFWGL